MMATLKRMIRNLRGRADGGIATALAATGYWTKHNVTAHREFASPAESLEYFHWRNAQYFNYIDLMPVTGIDDQAVLDLGCGPGNDLVGFGLYSRPSVLIGVDVSASSLEQAEARIRLHGIKADLRRLDPSDPTLPCASGSIDFIHSSGVLHHVPDPEQTLRESRRILKNSGQMRVMVYNYSSLWLHLYVAYVKQIAEGFCKGMDVRDAFAKSTDGPDCPISRVYGNEEFIGLAERCGFRCEFLGTAISMWEMSILPRRFEALMSPELAQEHRDFLTALVFDDRGYPKYRGHYAGVDGCYLLTPQ